MNKVLNSSIKMDYETPESFYKNLNNIFSFCVDLAANNQNKKCKNYIGEIQNSLNIEWFNIYNGIFRNDWHWINPPYGRGLEKWIQKAYKSKIKVCMLIPSRTDTKYFHEYITKANVIVFLKGRITFVGCSETAPFPSQLVFFGKLTNEELLNLKRLNLGFVIEQN